jgi:hypothetical protein
MSHEPANVENPFTPAEAAALHVADRGAARNIVLLMVGIFLTGICIYSVVAYSVAY